MEVLDFDGYFIVDTGTQSMERYWWNLSYLIFLLVSLFKHTLHLLIIIVFLFVCFGFCFAFVRCTRGFVCRRGWFIWAIRRRGHSHCITNGNPILPPTLAATAPPRVSPPAPEMSLAITPLMAPLASRIRPFYRQRHQVNNFVIPPCTSINFIFNIKI